LVRYRVS